jgi:predicted alpha-1,2-mannosidase
MTHLDSIPSRRNYRQSAALFWVLTAAFLIIPSPGPCGPRDPVDWVNQRIGAISHLLVATQPTVQRPHGMMRVIPLRTPGCTDPFLSTRFFGFSVNVPSHRGAAAGALLPLNRFPAGRPEALYGEDDADRASATPYWHRLILEGLGGGIAAEVAVTEKAAQYRFTFRGSGPAGVVFRCTGPGVWILDDRGGLSGSESWGRGVTQYAAVRFRTPVSRASAWDGSAWSPWSAGSGKVPGRGSALFVEFDGPRPLTVEAAVAVSYIDADQAARNLASEIPSWDFDAVRKAGRDSWNRELGRIRIEGGTDNQRVVFYTALSRCFERMVCISESGRYYSAYDSRTHEDARPFYTDDWSWDTYRSLHPLRLLLVPEREQDMIASYVRMYGQSGWMPSFPLLDGDMGGMIGHHQAALVADAYFKGLHDFDVEAAYAGLRKNAFEGTMIPWREGPAIEPDRFYREKGWFPGLAPDEPETLPDMNPWERRQSVAVTVEHAYDDACLGRLAGALGRTGDSEVLRGRGLNYRNVYRTDTGFMTPRKADGTWVEPFDPRTGGGPGVRAYFAEVNSWMYTWQVPQDVPGLIGLMGGREAFVNRLDQLFEETPGQAKWTFLAQQPDATGLTGQFTAGNEQAFHVPYLFCYAGAPWRTQKRIRQILGAWFRNDLMGLAGDEDGGGLSSWFVFSALGFYPVCAGQPVYVIGSPLFKRGTIQLGNGKTFTVEAPEASVVNKYIRSASLNGHPLDRPWFQHSELASGGTLELRMGPEPNPVWGSLPEQAPPVWE